MLRKRSCKLHLAGEGSFSEAIARTTKNNEFIKTTAEYFYKNIITNPIKSKTKDNFTTSQNSTGNNNFILERYLEQENSLPPLDRTNYK